VTVTKTYPEGEVTPYGADLVLAGDEPMVSYVSFDRRIAFHMMGGMAPTPGPTLQEGVLITSLKGLVGPWDMIDHQSANQDGVTFIDSVSGAIEVEIGIEAHGRTPRGLRQVMRDWRGSWSPKREGVLSWKTHEMGHWWAPVRWYKNPLDAIGLAAPCVEKWTWVARADSAFWRSYDDVDVFQFAYEDMTDTFTLDRTVQKDLGPNWPQYYDGDGGGYCYSNGHHALWRDDPDDLFTTRSREVVNGPFKDFETDTDRQVVNIVMGTIPEWSFPQSGADDGWGRMGRDIDGNWDGCGIRMRVVPGGVQLTAFVDFDAVWNREFYPPLFIPPLFGEKFTLVLGFGDQPRLYKVLRNGGGIFSYKETGTASMLGADYRGIGFGMRAGGAFITQATPGVIRKVSSGDNSSDTQKGFLKRRNAGDQEAYDRYTCFGPGTFKIANGPGGEMIEFGPLLPSQIVQIRANPRGGGGRNVVDLTSVPPTAAELAQYKTALDDVKSFAASNNSEALLSSLASVNGVVPPQGNMYRLLKGRFTEPIPAREPGEDQRTYDIACEIVNGNADSKILASLTPMRRYPA